MSLRLTLERYFEFQALGADWKTEILAGFTTFMTMAYIVFVNPAILHETGMPLAAVTAATCISAAIGSLLMGGFARYPIALAPGMGLNAYFTYTVVKGMGVPWQTALGAVFLSGVAFLAAHPARRAPVDPRPPSLTNSTRRWPPAWACSSPSSASAIPASSCRTPPPPSRWAI